MELVLEMVAEVVRDHEVDMSGSAFGAGWDIWSARCKTCGGLDRNIWPAEHIAMMLSESGLLVSESPA